MNTTNTTNNSEIVEVSYLRRKPRFSSMDRVEPAAADMTIQSACAILIADVQDLVWDYGNHEKFGHKMSAARASIDVQGFITSYFRVGPVFNKTTGSFHKGIMLARIEIDDKHRGQGGCRCIIDGLEELCDDMHLVLMVENVMEPMTSWLAKTLRRRGYEEHLDGLNISPNFYRWNPKAPAFTLTT